MKRDVKFYRRDKTVKFRGSRFRGNNRRYRRLRHPDLMLGRWYYPCKGKQRRSIENYQLIIYLKTGNEDILFSVKKGIEDWS